MTAPTPARSEMVEAVARELPFDRPATTAGRIATVKRCIAAVLDNLPLGVMERAMREAKDRGAPMLEAAIAAARRGVLGHE